MSIGFTGFEFGIFSIYSRSLQAVPFLSPNCVQQSISGSIGIKEKLLQKIEPWIRRELHAILGDPDPSVIVHVATSLYISSLEQQQIDGGSFLAPLRPFLHDKTSLFWHELRYVICDESVSMKVLFKVDSVQYVLMSSFFNDLNFTIYLCDPKPEWSYTGHS